MKTLALPALAGLITVFATSALCQPQAASMADWKRAVGCVALMDKKALENERATASLSAAMRQDPKMVAQVPLMQRDQSAALAQTRGLSKTMLGKADAMLAANYETWARAAALPPAAELARREREEATRIAARPNNPFALIKAIDDQHCEDFLVGDR
jgi:hypothetical protein